MKCLSWVVVFILFTANIAHAAAFQDLSLEAFRNKMNDDGKPKLVYIFTAWCSVCKKNFLLLEELYASYGESGKVDFIALSLDSDPDNLDNFVNAFSPSFQVYRLNYSDGMVATRLLYTFSISYMGRVPHINVRDKEQNVLIDGAFDYHDIDAVLKKFGFGTN